MGELVLQEQDDNKEVNVRSPRGSSKAKQLRNIRDAKERGDTYDDQTKKEESRSQVRQELWKYFQSPALALYEALR